MRITSLACAAAILIPFSVHAQQSVNSTWPVATTSRIRIQAPILGDKRPTGTVMAATNDSLVFQLVNESANRSLALTDIKHLEVARGTHTNRWKGALLGFAILGGASAVYTAATWQKSDEGSAFFDFGRAGDAAFIGGFGAILGAVAGVIIGSKHSDTWVPVQLR
jgi:hypothetical protein